MKKMLGIYLKLIIGIMIITGLTMCKKQEESVAVKSNEGLESITLTMVIPGTPQQDQPLVNAVVSEYLKEELNINLDLQQIDWSGWSDRSNLIVASGESVDIIFTAGWSNFDTDAAKGAFLELNKLIDEFGQDIKNSSYNWTLDATTVGGRLFAIPSYQMLAQQRGFLLNKGLVEKYGFEVNDVNKPEDLEPMLKIIKENEPGIIPFYGTPGKLLSYQGPWERQGQFETTTIDVLSGNAKYVNFYETDYYKKSMKLARKWFLAGYVNKDIATTRENGINMLKTGKVFAISFQTNEPELDSLEKRAGMELVRFSVIPPILSTGLVQGATFAISRTSKNPERAMMFLNKLHSDKKLVNTLVYGIENTHYVKISDNVINAAPGIDESNPAYINLNWMFGNQALLYTYGNEDPDAPKILDEFNRNAIRSPAFGFTYDPSGMKSEIAALTNVASEFDPVISSGVTDIVVEGTYESFLAKLKTAGMSRLLADQQAQLDAWLATAN